MKRIIKNIFPALKENMPYHHVLLFIYKKINHHYFFTSIYETKFFSFSILHKIFAKLLW